MKFLKFRLVNRWQLRVCYIRTDSISSRSHRLRQSELALSRDQIVLATTLCYLSFLKVSMREPKYLAGFNSLQSWRSLSVMSFSSLSVWTHNLRCLIMNGLSPFDEWFLSTFKGTQTFDVALVYVALHFLVSVRAL